MEFGAVVEGNGLEPVWFGADDLGNGCSGMGGGPVGELGEPGQAGHALHEGKDTLVPVLSQDRVRFPVAEFQPVIDLVRPLGNVAFPTQNAAGIIAAAALTASFGHDPEVLVEGTATAPVLANPTIYGLEAYGEQAVAFEVPGDLFRAPLELQELDHEVPAFWRVVGSPSLPATPCSRIRMGFKWGIPSLRRPLVSTQLPINGASCAAKGFGDLGNGHASGF